MEKDYVLDTAEITKKRYDEIDRLLTDDEILKDSDKVRSLNIEHSNIEETVNLYNQYLQAKQNKEDAELLKMEKDPELQLLGSEEYTKQSNLMEELYDKIQISLLPKDEMMGKTLSWKSVVLSAVMKQIFSLVIFIECMLNTLKKSLENATYR